MEAVAAVLEDELSQLPELKGLRVSQRQGTDGFELVITRAPGQEEQPVMRMDARGIISLTSSAQELLTKTGQERITKRLVKDLPRINQKVVQEAIRNGMVRWVKQ